MEQQTFTDVIELIFGKLQVRYGAAWLRQWDGVDMNLVKSDWGSELVGFANNLEPLRYALRHLPERCPNVGQFRAIANGCPLPQFKQLPAPAADPAVVAEELARQSGIRNAIAHREDGKQWARRILSRIQNGDTSISRYAAMSARMALGMEPSHEPHALHRSSDRSRVLPTQSRSG